MIIIEKMNQIGTKHKAKHKTKSDPLIEIVALSIVKLYVYSINT